MRNNDNDNEKIQKTKKKQGCYRRGCPQTAGLSRTRPWSTAGADERPRLGVAVEVAVAVAMMVLGVSDCAGAVPASVYFVCTSVYCSTLDS